MLLLSVSDLKEYLECPQKFHYRVGQRRAADKQSEALDLGTLFHRCIAAKREGASPQAIREVADGWLLEIGGGEHAEKVFKKYLQYEAALLEWEPPAGDVKAVEVKHRLPLIPGKVDIVGQLDTVVYRNTRWWHDQYKTIDPSRPRASFAEAQRTDWHETVYHWMIDEFYGESVGTMLCLFLKQTVKAMKAGAPLVETWPLPRERDIEERTKADILSVAERIVAELDGAPFIRNRGACNAHNSLCPFKEVCDGVLKISDPRYIDYVPRYKGV